MLNIEGVLFGVTSTDVLFHLGKEEISFPPHSGDRLRRLANHLIQQRSFYPLYPPNEELSLDVEQLEVFGQVRPD
jgi:DNA polymerase alpha subunit B